MEQAVNENVVAPVAEQPATESAVAVEQPIDATGTSVIDPASSAEEQRKLAEEAEAKRLAEEAEAKNLADEAANKASQDSQASELEAPHFAERAFVEEKNDGVQASAEDRIFVAGVGFITVSHPKE